MTKCRGPLQTSLLHTSDMVWSGCALTKNDGDAMKAAATGQSFVLRPVRLPCPYRVPMRIMPRMYHYIGSEKIPARRPFWSFDSDGPRPHGRLPPLTATASDHRSATAQSDVEFVKRYREATKEKISSAIDEIREVNLERLAIAQMARQQMGVRAGERKAVEKKLGYRVQAPPNTRDNATDRYQFESFTDYLNHLGGAELMGMKGSPLLQRLGNPQYRLKERLWRVDQKSRQLPWWSDRLNKWITLKNLADEGHVFWSFVCEKEVGPWMADPCRFHYCTCEGHCSHHEEGGEFCPCQTCEQRWAIYRLFIKKMQGRLKMLRQGKISKKELRLKLIEEAKQLRASLEAMAQAERLRKKQLRKARESTRASRQRNNTRVTTIKEVTEGSEQSEDLPMWDDLSDAELADIAREDDDDDDDNELGVRSGLEFIDKMYEVDEDDFQFISDTPSTASVQAAIEKTPEEFNFAMSPTPSALPPFGPRAGGHKRDRREPAPKKKKSKKKPVKQTPPAPSPVSTPEPIVEPPTPQVEEPYEPVFGEPEGTPPSPPPPVSKRVSKKRSVNIEEMEEQKYKNLHESPLEDIDFYVLDDGLDDSDEPAKVKLQRPANWGKINASSIADELTLQPSKGEAKRRALDRAIAKRQQGARNRKPKELEMKEESDEEEVEPDPDWLQQFYFLQGDKSTASRCRFAYQSMEAGEDSKLVMEQVHELLCRVNPKLSEQETFYICRVLELMGADMQQGVDLRLFTIMTALSQRLTALDDWVRTMVNEIDFRLLEYKMDYCKRFWLTCSDDERRMSEDQFRILLLAGGVTIEHERSACTKLFADRPEPHTLDLLDFLTYLPLFIAIHLRIMLNAVDDARTQ